MASTNNPIVFKRFSEVSEAKELVLKLRENGIESTLVNNAPPLDITFTADHSNDEIQLLVSPEDYNKARNILEAEVEDWLDDVDEDHYLFEFTTEELFEVLEKPDEWNPLDYKLAQKILNDRGKPVDKELLDKFKEQRKVDIAKPIKAETTWIIVGYVFGLLGGLVGVFIGWFFWRSRRTLPDGSRDFYYKDSDRTHGFYIFYLSLFMIFIWSGIWVFF